MASATRVGLHGLTIGELARKTGLSKSGLFAHFRSKENLQIAVLDKGVERFIDLVVRPAIEAPRGAPRVRALFDNWLAWAHEGSPRGCIFASATFELTDRPGSVREYLVGVQRDWMATLERAVQLAIDAGHFAADTDARQAAFEIQSVMLGSLHGNLLIRDPDALDRARSAFDRILERLREGARV